MSITLSGAASYAQGISSLDYGGDGYGVPVGPVLGYGFSYGIYGPAYGGIAPGGYSAPYGGYGSAVPGLADPSGGYGYPAMPYRNGSANLYANPQSRTESNYPSAQQPRPQQPVPQRERPPQKPAPQPELQPPTRNPQQQEMPLEKNTARVAVIVPEEAELWFNGTKTTQTGTRREFDTPTLTPGQDFKDTIKARWTEGGKPVEVTHTVQVRANTMQVIDLTKITAPDSPQK